MAEKYIKENANVAAQYASWLVAENAQPVDSLPRGEGIVMNQGLKKIAVYRTTKGDLKTLSAACPHLGGVVSWNSVEKSWDCPCHGSRFNCFGKVIEGPAVSDLQEVTELTNEGEMPLLESGPQNFIPPRVSESPILRDSFSWFRPESRGRI